LIFAQALALDFKNCHEGRWLRRTYLIAGLERKKDRWLETAPRRL
jgi:hypothetical protein